MSNYPFETFPLTKRIGIVNPVANLDARYGPWPTFNDALTGFSSAVRQRGLTVAVSGVGGIVEYWYKDGIANNNLVLKSSDITEADILPTVTNYLSTNNVLLSAFTAAAPCVIQTSTTTPALRINQTGSGSALTVVGTISTSQHGTSQQWNQAYTTVSALSASWEESADILPTVTNYLSTNNVLISALTITNTASNINSLTVVGNISATGAVYSNPPLRILASNETNLNTDSFTTFVKLITAPNAFTFTNFTSGKTITLYLCAGHLNFSRHYFPQTTYISEAGEGNTVYTFENYITKLTLQNVGTQFIGTTDIIPINIEQVIPVAPIGASIILEDRLGYLKQEDGSYILL